MGLKLPTSEVFNRKTVRGKTSKSDLHNLERSPASCRTPQKQVSERRAKPISSLVIKAIMQRMASTTEESVFCHPFGKYLWSPCSQATSSGKPSQTSRAEMCGSVLPEHSFHEALLVFLTQALEFWVYLSFFLPNCKPLKNKQRQIKG